MAGNYRSNDNGIGKSVGRAVHASRSTHVKKNIMEKQRELAKDVISHRETERRKTIETAGAMTIKKALIQGAHSVNREKYKLEREKQKGANKKLSMSKKPTNDLQVGKKTKEAPKKRKLATDRKW